MNHGELIKLVESQAAIPFWQVMKEHESDFRRWKAEASFWHQSARQSGSKREKEFAKECEQNAELLRKQGIEERRPYWRIHDGLRELSPGLLGELPLIDGQDVADIDPAAAARRMLAILGALLAVEPQRETLEEVHDRLNPDWLQGWLQGRPYPVESPGVVKEWRELYPDDWADFASQYASDAEAMEKAKKRVHNHRASTKKNTKGA